MHPRVQQKNPNGLLHSNLHTSLCCDQCCKARMDETISNIVMWSLKQPLAAWKAQQWFDSNILHQRCLVSLSELSRCIPWLCRDDQPSTRTCQHGTSPIKYVKGQGIINSIHDTSLHMYYRAASQQAGSALNKKSMAFLTFMDRDQHHILYYKMNITQAQKRVYHHTLTPLHRWKKRKKKKKEAYCHATLDARWHPRKLHEKNYRHQLLWPRTTKIGMELLPTHRGFTILRHSFVSFHNQIASTLDQSIMELFWNRLRCIHDYKWAKQSENRAIAFRGKCSKHVFFWKSREMCCQRSLWTFNCAD